MDGGDPYAIPKDNPFIGNEGFRDEVWAWGVRNPWRFCFDPLNGDLYFGDVGQNRYEELHWQPGSSKGGENYGWRLYEGSHEFRFDGSEEEKTLVPPIHEYSQGGASGHCSVTGGYVYRGSAIPGLDGTYFYGDFCSGAVGSFRVVDGKRVDRRNHSEELDLDHRLTSLVSFGLDAAGELYLVTMGGTVFRLIEADTEAK